MVQNTWDNKCQGNPQLIQWDQYITSIDIIGN